MNYGYLVGVRTFPGEEPMNNNVYGTGIHVPGSRYVMPIPESNPNRSFELFSQSLNDILETENVELRFQKTIQTLRLLALDYIQKIPSSSANNDQVVKIHDSILKLLKELEECVTAPAKFYPDAPVKNVEFLRARAEFEALAAAVVTETKKEEEKQM